MIGVRDEYRTTFGRQVLSLWSGQFGDGFEGMAVELPGHDGFMVTLDKITTSEKVRVSCPAPRTESNFDAVDAAISAAITEARAN